MPKQCIELYADQENRPRQRDDILKPGQPGGPVEQDADQEEQEDDKTW